MAGCCNPRGCDRAFTARFARSLANRYRKHGLDKTARRMVDHLAERGIEGATVLEVGGGVGDIQIELLKRGARHAVNLELSTAYDAEAARLLDEAGLSGRAERYIVDIAATPSEVDEADVVVLHRVVCCYPDVAGLLGAAAGHARRQVVFSYPRRNLVSRAFIAGQNLGYRLSGKEFRIFVHPPQTMLAVLADHGLRPEPISRGFVWQATAAAR